VAISLMFGHKVGKTLEGLEFDPGKIGQCWFPGIFWVSWTSWFKAYVQHEIKKKQCMIQNPSLLELMCHPCNAASFLMSGLFVKIYDSYIK
jgi:Fe-S cluster biosynthesis and repair protein YggX